MKQLKAIVLTLIAGALLSTTPLEAGSVYDTGWDPPDVRVDENHPYYFPLWLPAWGFDYDSYTNAMFELTYYDQYKLDIFIFAADPNSDTSDAASYNILLGTVPYTTMCGAGTAQFDLLTSLSTVDFEQLFKGQSILYLVADCHYMFDKVNLHMAAGIPIPSTVLFLGLGFIGLIILGRGVKLKGI